MKQLKWMIAVVLVLSGCATGVKHKDMASAIPSLKPDQGRVYFFRSASMFGAAIQPEIRMDGAVVGTSQPGGFFFVDAQPGNHEVITTTEVERRLTFVLAQGETKYVKTTIGLGIMVGRVVPELVSAAEAASELSDLSYTGTTLAQQPVRPGSTAAVSTAAPVAGAAVPAARVSAPVQQAVPTRVVPVDPYGPLQLGETLTYQLTDRLTRKTSNVTYRVDQIDTAADRISFNQGSRVEDSKGKVLKLGSVQAGLFESAMPPSGWFSLPLTPGKTWSESYGDADAKGKYKLSATVLGNETVTTPIGTFETTKISWKGWVNGELVNGSRRNSSYTVLAWYSPQLNRIIKFTAAKAPANMYSPPEQEVLELSRRAIEQAGVAAIPSAASAQAVAYTPSAPLNTQGPLQLGETLTYQVTDRLTRKTRNVAYRVDQIDTAANRIAFNQGSRIEDNSGKLLKLDAIQFGMFDSMMPPGGWVRLPANPGASWSENYNVRDIGQFKLNAMVSGEEKISTPLGQIDTLRVQWKGWVSGEGIAGGRTLTGASQFNAVAWYSPKINRVVKFTATKVSTMYNSPDQEVVELQRRAFETKY
jgi:hypothetical protein